MSRIIEFSLGLTLICIAFPAITIWDVATTFCGGVLVAISLKTWIVNHTDNNDV